jgi:hypothetical protein
MILLKYMAFKVEKYGKKTLLSLNIIPFDNLKNPCFAKDIYLHKQFFPKLISIKNI